jgi:hypothetical protein
LAENLGGGIAHLHATVVVDAIVDVAVDVQMGVRLSVQDRLERVGALVHTHATLNVVVHVDRIVLADALVDVQILTTSEHLPLQELYTVQPQLMCS